MAADASGKVDACCQQVGKGPGGAQRIRFVGIGRGHIWIAGYGDDSVYVFLGGDPNQSVGVQQYEGSQRFDLVLAADGTAWVTNGGLTGEDPNSVAKYALVNGALQRQFLNYLGQALKGLSLDSRLSS